MTSPLMVEDVLDEGARSDTAAPSDVQKQGGNGPLLDEQDEKKVVEAIVQMLHNEAPNRRRRRAEWECNKLWLKGVRGARVRRSSEDRNAVELVVPLGAFDLPPVMDRVDELLEKFVSHLTGDPAVPEAEPSTDSDSDRDAAEFTTRLLTVEGSESGYNNQAVIRKAARKAGVYGSGFIYPCLDPQGGGWRPMEVRALPTATSTQDANIDPATMQPVPEEDPRLQTRFVAQGQITDDASQADKQWIPKIHPEVLTGEQVVLLPNTCSGISSAHGVILIRFTPLGKLRATFKKRLGDVEDDAILQKLVEWRPEDSKHAKPGFLAGKDIQGSQSDSGKVKDSALVCTLSLYYKSHGDYPKGAYLCVAGGDMVLHKQTWSGMVQSGQQVREECMELPIAQARQFDDDVDDDPYGYGLVRKIGPADEVRGNIVLAWQEYLDKFLHPIPFLPLGSIVQPNQMHDRDDTPVYFNPQGKPEWEKPEPFPPDGKEFFDRATDAQDSATMLEETAQGADSPNVKSGVHAQAVIQQSHVNMSAPRNNLADCQERLWRIIAQQIRVFYTVPMKLKYQGDDGAYKEREWTRADLGSTKDIRIARGSFTQMAPEQKQANLDARYAQGLVDPEEYERLSASNIRASIGFQDNPHRLRVRKQISEWRDGNVQAFADVRPVDEEQDVARIRYLELRRVIAGSDYLKGDQASIQNEYLLMRQAAGVATLAEQQQAAMQQQQMAADQQAQSEGKQLASKEKQSADATQAQGAESEAQRAFEADQNAQDRESQLMTEAMRAQGAPMQPA